MVTRLDEQALALAHGGMAWEHFSQSSNVEDHRDRYSPSEDGTLHDNYTGRTVADGTINQDPGGWRDDQETGNRTWIGPDGNSDTVERPDGSVTPAPSVWDEARPSDGTQANDFNFGQFPGGENTGGSPSGSAGAGESRGGGGGAGESGGYGGSGAGDESGGYGGRAGRESD